MMPQVAITALLVIDVCVAVDPPCDPEPLWVGTTFALLFPPFAVPIAVGLHVMSMFPAMISLVAEGFDVAFESPTLDVPLALGFEEEVASPPVVEPVVFDVALALEPPESWLDDEPDAVALALLPLVLPLVDDLALDPEPVTAAAPSDIASASAAEFPTIARPFKV